MFDDFDLEIQCEEFYNDSGNEQVDNRNTNQGRDDKEETENCGRNQNSSP